MVLAGLQVSLCVMNESREFDYHLALVPFFFFLSPDSSVTDPEGFPWFPFELVVSKKTYSFSAVGGRSLA